MIATHCAPVLILGAGPAGLSVAFELKRRGVPFVILEKGDGPGESWKNMPRNLKLVSPWKTNYLRGSRRNLFSRHEQLSREQYFNYLQDYAKSAGLPLQTRSEAQAIEKTADGLFRVQTARGDFFANVVVNATGYFANPFIPSISGALESTIPQLHVANYRDPEQLRDLITKKAHPPNGHVVDQGMNQTLGRTFDKVNESPPLVLIVGKRLSAGQLMLELTQAGFSVALCHRTPIKFGVEAWAWWLLFRIFPWLEWLKLKLRGTGAASNDVRMQGGLARKLIESDVVKTFPSIRRFERDAVVFEDGQQLQPHLVLYATGFRPALNHLNGLDICFDAETGRPQLRDLESVSVPALYFLGLDHGRNFQSRFIRGIRKDAAFLAERLQHSLSLTSSLAACGSRTEKSENRFSGFFARL